MENERLSQLSANTFGDLMRERYRLLLVAQTVWLITTRIVFFAAVLIVAWMPRHSSRGLLLVTTGGVLYGLVGWYAERTIERKRFRLEKLFVEQLPQEDPLMKIYIEWRYQDWEHSLGRRVVHLEPFLWIALLIVALVT